MAYPIVSHPWREDIYWSPGRDHYERRSHVTQSRPYDLVLTAVSEIGDAFYSPSNQAEMLGGYISASSMVTLGRDNGVTARLSSECASRLQGKVYSAVAAGVSLLEGRQSLEMIANALRTLAGAARALRRRNLKDFYRRLKIPKDRQGKQTAKSFADLWLQYHFGWDPLLSDIYQGLQLLVNPIQTYVPVSAKASDGGSDWSSVNNGFTVTTQSRSWTTTVKAGCIVKAIRDPGAFTLEQFGLNNPAVLAWESVPYSFVVDWIANVGDFLQSFTAYAGLQLDREYTTVFHRSEAFGSTVRTPDYTWDLHKKNSNFKSKGIYFSRGAGLPNVTLQLKKFKQPSKTRALTAVSLLLQLLR